MNAKDNDGLMPLYEDCKCGYEYIVSLLFANGADVNAKDDNERAKANYGKMPLHSGACKKGHKAVISLLLENGANLHAKNMWGNMTLHHASSRGNKNIVSLLLERAQKPMSKTVMERCHFILLVQKDMHDTAIFITVGTKC